MKKNLEMNLPLWYNGPGGRAANALRTPGNNPPSLGPLDHGFGVKVKDVIASPEGAWQSASPRYPGFEPPSPMYPFRPRSKPWQSSKPPKTDNRRITKCNRVSTTESTTARAPTGAGWGSGGGRLKVGISVPVCHRSSERLCGQHRPQPLSLVRFLCGSQEMNTEKVCEQN